MSHLNLSRRAFVNTRPVTRVALLLWIVGGLLLLGNVTLFYGYLSGSREARTELAGKREEIEQEQKKVGELQARLAGLNLEQQNEQVEYLNRKIAERAFSWSLLFDRLAEVMPNDVRLIQLQPASIGGGDDRPGSRSAASGGAVRGRRPVGTSDRVPLTLQVEAKSDVAVDRLVDNLFAHNAFDEPDYTRETREEEESDNSVVRFDLTVIYIPGGEARTGTGQEPAMEVVEEETPPATPAGEPAAENEPGNE